MSVDFESEGGSSGFGAAAHAKAHAKPQAQTLAQVLARIEVAQLIRRQEEAQLTFLFKHTLVQETAYASLMRHDRRRLHQLVAQALQAENAEVDGELAAILGEHYKEAGEPERARSFFQQAGDVRAARFENREALTFYALALDSAQQAASPARAALYRARGLVHERIGELEAARADLEHALEWARREGDGLAEWQGLLDLGFFWSASNYPRAGEYLEQALALARERDDPMLIAHTENRVGNWHLNNQESARALEYHHLALQTFQMLKDARGIAETQDLLGMTEMLSGNLIASREHYLRALEQFAIMQDPFGELASRISLELQTVNLQTDTVVLLPPYRALEEELPALLLRCRELGWPSGESFHLWVCAQAFASRGEYDKSLELLERAIAIAREINHRQWLTSGTVLRGAVLTNLFEYQAGAEQIEAAVELAQEIGSTAWIWITANFLALNLIGQGQLERAAQVLDRIAPDPSPIHDLAQRQHVVTRVELALAQRQPERALERLDYVMRHTANLTPETVIPRLWQLRAEAYAQLGQHAEAILLLEAALPSAVALGTRPQVWQIQRDLARLYSIQGQAERAAQSAAAARELIAELAAAVPSPLRERYLQSALAQVPAL